MVKDLPAVQETRVRSLGGDDLLEQGIETHSSILAWRIPWTEEPGGLQSEGHTELDATEAIWHTQYFILIQHSIYPFTCGDFWVVYSLGLLYKMHVFIFRIFPVGMYGCEIWTIKKAEHRRNDAFEL